jgi:hypothetical protein
LEQVRIGIISTVPGGTANAIYLFISTACTHSNLVERWQQKLNGNLKKRLEFDI